MLLNHNTPDIYFAPFKRKLKQKIKSASIHLEYRQGFLLKAVWPDRISYGEASPLDNYSLDSFDSVYDFLQNSTREPLVKLWLETKDIPQSLRMAIDSIFANNIALEKNPPIENNAMIPLFSGLEAIIDLLQSRWHQGYRIFKFKVDAKNTDLFFLSLEHLNKISKENHSEKYQIRIDSNQSFQPNTIIEFASAIRNFPIEYWEDPLPLNDLYSWQYFKKECPIPIAIDQAMKCLANIQFALDNKLADIFILKPTCIGGLNETKKIMSLLQKAGKIAILTSAMETEVGRRSLQNFALEYYPWKRALGFSTGDFFENNFLPDSPQISSLIPINTAEEIYLNSLEWLPLQ